MCSFHAYELKKYCKDKLTISYLFSVHVHKHFANLGKHEHIFPYSSAQSWGKMVGEK